MMMVMMRMYGVLDTDPWMVHILVLDPHTSIGYPYLITDLISHSRI